MIDQKLCYTCNHKYYRELFAKHSNVCNYCRERGKGLIIRIDREVDYLGQWVKDPHHCAEFMSKVKARIKELNKEKAKLAKEK